MFNKKLEKVCALCFLFCSFQITSLEAQTITQIVDSTGGGHSLSGAHTMVIDSADNIYIAGETSDNVLKITPGGVITEILDSTGDGTNTFDAPRGLAIDGAGNIYAPGRISNNVFKVTPAGVITQIIDSTGDGGGNTLAQPGRVAVDSSGNVFVAGDSSDNAFKITAGGVVTEIIDTTGDGTGNTLGNATGVAVDGDGNVYITGRQNDNVFKITPGGVITEIIDETGDGSNDLNNPYNVIVDGSNNVYVTGWSSANAFKIAASDGAITEIIDSTGDGTESLGGPYAIAIDGSGNIYISEDSPGSAFKVSSGGTVSNLITLNGDGTNDLRNSRGIVLDSSNNVYVSGYFSNNVFKITQDTSPPSISSVSIPDSAHKVGDTVTATLTVTTDTDDYTTGSGGISGTIGGYALGSLAKVNDTTYEADFTITDGGTDVAAGSNIAVSFTLADSAGNTSAAFTTAINQVSDAIYANLPDVALTTDTNTIAEDGGVATLTATLSNSLNNQWPDAVTVNLAYTGTGTAATDYAKSDSIVIGAGSSSNTSTVTGSADTLFDAAAAETAIVDIASLSVGNEGTPNQQTIRITDAETAPTVTLSVGNNSLAENGGSSTITAALSHATYAAVTVNLAYTGTAVSGGTDYNTPSSSIVIGALSLNANAATGITAVDDGSADGDLSIVIDVSSVTGGSAAEEGTQQESITLVDDENSPPVVASSIGAQSGVSGSSFTEDVSGNFSDPNGDSLSFSATGLPTGLTISAAGVISGTIQTGLTGDFNVTVTATDPSTATIQDGFVLSVTAPAPPPAPAPAPAPTPAPEPEPTQPTDPEPPALPTIDSEGNETSTQISGGVTTGDGIFAQQGLVEVGDAIEIIATIAPELEHFGEPAGVLIAIVDAANPQVILLMNALGGVEVFDGQTLVFSDQINLESNNLIDITRGIPITLTSGEIGTYNVFVGYQLFSDGVIYYNSEPIVIDVLQ